MRSLTEQKIILQYFLFRFLILLMAQAPKLKPRAAAVHQPGRTALNVVLLPRAEPPAGGAPKVFAVLEAIASVPRPLTVSELAALLGVPKPTMHRIVRQLDAEGLLQREPHTRLYGPGPRLVSFAMDVVRSSMRLAPRHAVLEALSAKVGETCNFGMIAGNAVVYLDRVEASWPFGLKFEAGSRVPLHCTSMGKLLLSALPRQRRDALIAASTLSRYTENTITDRAALRRELDEIRKRGYSVDNQEFLAGVVCLAVPVRDKKGAVCAALAISAPEARMSTAEAIEHLPTLQSAAENLAAQVGQG
jgi:IclR family acetate operon transcriptional repressor